MEENEKIELMYRRPGKEEYELLTDVIDDILIRLEKLEDSSKSDKQEGKYPPFLMANIDLRRRHKTLVDISLAFEPSPLNNDITVLRNDRAVDQAIKNIVLTAVGEVPFNYNMGSEVTTYLFEDYGPATNHLISNEIKRAIKYSEPRVEVESVVVESQVEENQVACTVSYKITGYDTIFTVSNILVPTR